jgi:hypothetical protein
VGFLDNGVSIGSAPLATNGQAAFTTTQLGLGLHFVVADYGGDANFAASNSLGAHVTIAQAGTTTTLSSSANPSGYEQAVKFTAAITPAFGSGATGTIMLYSGSTQIGHAAVTANRATFSTYLLREGMRSITAKYSGDTNFLGSSSNTFSQMVNPATTATSLNSSQNPSHAGQTVTFTAKVTGHYGGIPAGNVTFKEGTETLGTVALSEGLAKFSTASLAHGSHTINATYNGNADFQASSATLTQVVK